MSLLSRLSAAVRSASRSPAVRRGARDLGRAAVRALQDRRRTAPPGGPEDPTGPAGVRRDGTPGTRPGSPASDGRSGPRAEGRALPLADRAGIRSLSLDYAPREDDRPDPGEVVWGWVHYEEDLTRGKDRPVLVIAREPARRGGTDGEGEVLVALMLTSRDHTAAGTTATDEHGSTWVDIGAGDWDRRGRPSEVRADRLLRLDPDAVRREGGRLDRRRFEQVAAAVRAAHHDR